MSVSGGSGPRVQCSFGLGFATEPSGRYYSVRGKNDMTASRALLLAVALIACKEKSPPLSGADTSAKTSTSAAQLGPSFAWDLDDIRKRDTLIVLAPYNSTTYFLYKGEAMGYEYELLKDFAKDVGVELRMVLVQNRDSMFNMLRQGKGDIAAARLIPLPED